MSPDEIIVLRSTIGQVWGETVTTPEQLHNLLRSVEHVLTTNRQSAMYFRTETRVKALKRASSATAQDVKQVANEFGRELTRLLTEAEAR